jgi:Tfp pilus assembly protein PilE
MRIHVNHPNRRKRGGFTLEEMVISMGITLGCLAGIVSGYRLTMYRADWAAHSSAVQAMVMQRMEQVRAARWEPMAFPAVDDLVPANFPPLTKTLDMPLVGTNVPQVTVTTTISNLVANPPMKWVQIECVWSCGERGPFVNRVTTLVAPDA